MNGDSVGKTMGWLILACLAVGLYYVDWKRIKFVRPAMTPLEKERVIEGFQRRRSLALRFGLLPALIGFGICIILPPACRMVAGDPAVLFHINLIYWLFAGFGLAAIGIMIGAMIYRCPVCGQPPWARHTSGGKAVSADPVRCTTCGTRLKKPEA